jgi:hypothetical protein
MKRSGFALTFMWISGPCHGQPIVGRDGCRRNASPQSKSKSTVAIGGSWLNVDGAIPISVED